MTVAIDKLHKRWSKDPAYRQAYEELGLEFELAQQLIKARLRARLTQAEVAERMGTTQSVVARIESGKTKPSISTLERYASATGCKLRVSLVATR